MQAQLPPLVCMLAQHVANQRRSEHCVRFSQVQLASAVCDARFLTPSVLRLFTDDSPDEVVLPECSALDAPCFSEAMAQCASPR